jgi:pyruvate ferredoxin oxidoreductase beta subunit
VFPLAEWRNGSLATVKRIAAPLAVDEYLRPQSRFKHLFADEAGEIERGFLQELADEGARRLGIAQFDGRSH